MKKLNKSEKFLISILIIFAILSVISSIIYYFNNYRKIDLLDCLNDEKCSSERIYNLKICSSPYWNKIIYDPLWSIKKVNPYKLECWEMINEETYKFLTK